MKSSRRSRTEARMKATLTLTPVLLVALVMARPFAVQPAQRLALELQDYASAADHGGQHEYQHPRATRARQLPARRAWRPPLLRQRSERSALHPRQADQDVHDVPGLQRRGGRPGLFPKFTFERNFATGLTNFLFDPDYARNGVFYTIHMEDPAAAAPAAPKAGVVAGLDLTGYTTTAAIPTPTVDGRIEREVVLIEWKDREYSERDVRRHGAGAVAPAAPHANPPAGRDDVQSRRATGRSGLAGHVSRGWRLAARASSATAAA